MSVQRCCEFGYFGCVCLFTIIPRWSSLAYTVDDSTVSQCQKLGHSSALCGSPCLCPSSADPGAYILFVQDVIPETPGKLQPPKKQLAGKGAAVGRQASGLPPRQAWHLLSLASDRKLLRVKPPSLIHQQLAV